MVIMAPMVAPALKMTVIKMPRMRMKRRHHLRLFFEKFLLALGHEVLQPIVAIEGFDQVGQFIGVFHAKRDGRERAAPEGVCDLVEVAPNLGIEAAAIGIEDADHAP